MAQMEKTKVDIKAFKEVLKFTIKNNRFLQSKGMVPIAIELTGDAGGGKTSAVNQVGKELGLKVIKISLAMLDELGDLIGIPVMEYEAYVTETKKEWVIKEAIKPEYQLTGETRMTYAEPEWIAGVEKGIIMLLDDFTRGQERFLQAVMELIMCQEYLSWKLPEDSHIVLTSNIDDGNYQINTLDDAQKSRYISLELETSVDAWAEWAEKMGIDPRCINFTLAHKEIFDNDKKWINPRSVTNFYNSISSMEDFESQLPLIDILANGSIGPELAAMFTTFIKNRLDKLPSMEDILFKGTDKECVKMLEKLFNEGGRYRSDIASILGTRIINYLLAESEKRPMTDELLTRVAMFITEEGLMLNDLKYAFTKRLVTQNKAKFARLLTLNSKVIDYVLE